MSRYLLCDQLGLGFLPDGGGLYMQGSVPYIVKSSVFLGPLLGGISVVFFFSSLKISLCDVV
jgi:hypothetical protein